MNKLCSLPLPSSCFLITLLILGLSRAALAQVGIGTLTPHASAQLDVVSSDKGILIPRVTSTASVTGTLAEGLTVYQTTGSEGFYYYDGSAWQKLIKASDIPSATYAYAATNDNSSSLDNPVRFTGPQNVSGVYYYGNDFSILTTGTYRVSYQVTTTTGLPSTRTAFIRKSGATLPGSANEYRTTGYNETASLQADVIVNLITGDTLALAFTSTEYYQQGNASITIVRLK